MGRISKTKFILECENLFWEKCCKIIHYYINLQWLFANFVQMPHNMQEVFANKSISNRYCNFLSLANFDRSLCKVYSYSIK